MKLAEYINDVKCDLISNWGMDSDAAEKAITTFKLKERIENCPLIASHDDPKSIAETIANDFMTI